MGQQKLLQRLQPKPLSDILNCLVGLSSTSGDDVPTVTFSLISGISYQGRILTANLNGEGMLVVELTNSGDVVYLPKRNVTAVIVHNAEHHAEELSFGGVDPAELREPPKPLSLKRFLVEFSEKVSETTGHKFQMQVLWDEFNRDDANALSALSLLVESTRNCIQNILDDDFSRMEFAKKVSQVQVTTSERKNVSLVNGILRIEMNLAKGLDGRYSEPDLAHQFNNLL